MIRHPDSLQILAPTQPRAHTHTNSQPADMIQFVFVCLHALVSLDYTLFDWLNCRLRVGMHHALNFLTSFSSNSFCFTCNRYNRIVWRECRHIIRFSASWPIMMFETFLFCTCYILLLLEYWISLIYLKVRIPIEVTLAVFPIKVLCCQCMNLQGTEEVMVWDVYGFNSHSSYEVRSAAS